MKELNKLIFIIILLLSIQYANFIESEKINQIKMTKCL